MTSVNCMACLARGQVHESTFSATGVWTLETRLENEVIHFMFKAKFPGRWVGWLLCDTSPEGIEPGAQVRRGAV